MPNRCFTPDEEIKVRELYKTGDYSMDKLASMFHVSKGTLVNVIHNYPYTTSREEYQERVYRQMRLSLTAYVEQLEKKLKAAFDNGNWTEQAIYQHQRSLLLEFARLDSETMLSALKTERTYIEHQAWKALSQGDYMRYAYSESLWKTITDILGDFLKNPFQRIIDKQLARNHANNVKYTGAKTFVTNATNSFALTAMRINNDNYYISDSLWREIKGAVSSDEKKTGRPQVDKRMILSGLIYCLITGRTTTDAAKKGYGKRPTLEKYYFIFWEAGLFRLLWQVSGKWPELSGAREGLANMELFRAAFPRMIPHLGNLKKA